MATFAAVAQSHAGPAPWTGWGWSGAGALTWLHLVSRAMLSTILLWAGLAKVGDHQSTVLAVDAYRLLPGSLVEPVAAALPWVEITLGLLLVAGAFVRFAGAVTALLMLGFLVALAQARARGLAIDCGCFGGGGTGTGVGWLTLLREVPLLAAGIFLAWRARGPLALDNLLFPEVDDDGTKD